MQAETTAHSGSRDLLVRALAETTYHRFPGGRKKLRALVDVIASFGPTLPRVLDVGCGNGALVFPIAALGCEVVGVDVDPTSIERCLTRNRFPHARFIRTAEDLAEVDGTFDLVVCAEVLEHLENPNRLIAAMREKLAPGGVIFITIPNGYGLREIGGRMEKLLRRRLGFERPVSALRRMLNHMGMASEYEKYEMHTSNPDQGHVQNFTPQSIVNCLAAQGLAVTAWMNSFVILSVFFCRTGLSFLERLDSWAADRLPAACASGWYITCKRRS